MKKTILLSSLLLTSNVMADNHLGLSIGTPAGINFVYKGDIANVPIQVSGAYWGDKAQGLELGYRFIENDSAFSSAQLLLGYSRTEDSNDVADEWSYIGASATFSYKGFYIEPGLSVGSGDYSNPQLLIQAGYTWEF